MVDQPSHSDDRPTAEDDSAPSSPADFLHDAQGHMEELGEYAGVYLSAKMAEMRRAVRRMILLAALGIIAVLVAIALVITACVMACAGVAHLLAHLLGDRLWAGELLTGVGIVVLGGLVIGIMARASRKAWRKRTVHYYESRKQEQLLRFGRNIDDAGRE